MDLLVAVRSGTMEQELNGTNRAAFAERRGCWILGSNPNLSVYMLTFWTPKKPEIPSSSAGGRNLLHSTHLGFLSFLLGPPFILQSLDRPSILFSILFRPGRFDSSTFLLFARPLQPAKILSTRSPLRVLRFYLTTVLSCFGSLLVSVFDGT